MQRILWFASNCLHNVLLTRNLNCPFLANKRINKSVNFRLKSKIIHDPDATTLSSSKPERLTFNCFKAEHKIINLKTQFFKKLL